MNLSVGIVGLPNVGKSTLFNALLKKQQALAVNYPFATIEPNVGVVPVPDFRLTKLAEITKVEEKMSGLPPIKPAMISFVDIAGLGKGASEGAGLGNKFLSHIREVSVIAHVVRAFSDEDVVREGAVDPKSDYETINMELMLADLATISKIKNQKPKTSTSTKATADKQVKNQRETAEKIFAGLSKGIPARDIHLTDEEKEIAKQFFLLSAKPEIVVLNVGEKDYAKEKIPEVIVRYTSILDKGRDKFVVICAKIESELSELSEEEQREYLKGLGLERSGLERLIQKAYETLGLISFLTAGEKEVRAWTIRKGISAQMAAGEIHTDFIKKFIKAEVVGYNDFVETGEPARNATHSVAGGWKKARELGKARQEGRDYVMQDGDVVEFKIGT